MVFIPEALPGELVRVEVVGQRAKSASARLVDLLEASPERVSPPCPEVERGCGGCQWQHITLEAQRRLKSEIVLNALRFAGVELPVVNPTVELAAWRYRTSLRAGVTPDGRAGFRRNQSHDLVAVDACMVAHPRLEELLVGPRYRGAEEVVLRCGDRTGERLASTTPPGIAIDVPDDVQSRWFHEHAAGRLWRVSAESFFQTRADGADALADLVAAAAAELDPATRALDLYSGVGLFAVALAQAGWSVTAVEGSPAAVSDARVNLADLPVKVVRADVTRWTPPPVDLVVADPSRIGLGKAGAAVVAAAGARRVVLVSCDAIALGRDAGQLRRRGYELTSLTQVDLFPHTFHVEVVSIFDANRG